MAFTQRSLSNLKDHIDIVEVVSRALPLKRTGNNFKGVCPFHNEKTPSFVVSEQKQIFTCFGCGATGDAIEFVKRYYNLDFNEAIERLASEYGVTMEKTGYSSEPLDEYYKINEDANRFFMEAFRKSGNKGYSYMANRGITDEIMDRFKLGYADGEWDSLYKYLLSKGHDKKKMIHLGLISESKGKCYDKFRNRVMFPIINTSDKVIGFGGRAIDPNDNPKYLNSPESKVFLKKNHLYGLNLARNSVGEQGFIILVEGYMDTIGLYQGGITNVSASLGTALTDNQARLIKRFTPNVVLSYDADQAGINAALRGMEVLRGEGLKVKVMHVTDGKDPDEFIKKEGREAFLELIKRALPYGDYKLSAIIRNFDINNPEDKIECLKRIAAAIRTMSPVEQDVYVKRIAKYMNVSERALWNEIQSKKKDESDLAAKQSKKKDDQSAMSEPLTLIEKDYIKLITRNEKYINRISEDSNLIETELGHIIYNALKEEYKSYGTVDLKRVYEALDEIPRAEFSKIVNDIPSFGEEEDVFTECLHKAKIREKERTRDRLRNQLDLADNSISIELQEELVKQISELEKEIAKLKIRR